MPQQVFNSYKNVEYLGDIGVLPQHLIVQNELSISHLTLSLYCVIALRSQLLTCHRDDIIDKEARRKDIGHRDKHLQIVQVAFDGVRNGGVLNFHGHRRSIQ